MKRKMKISGKKVVSSCLVFVMMCQLVGSNNMMIANAENEMDAETKTYIVMADSSKEFNDVTNRVAFSISEEDPELADNNIAVMELTPEEAEDMQENDGLIVEEDIIISANSLDGDLEEEIITECTEVETVLTEREEVTEESEENESADSIETNKSDTEITESTEDFTQEETEKQSETEDFQSVEKRAFIEKIMEEESNIPSGGAEADWNIQAVNADGLNTNARSIEKVKVALLDSGVDTISGIELADWTNMVEEEASILPVYQDLTGHGTGIASIICANGEGGIKGVNPNVDLYSVKVLDGENKAPLSRIIKGIYWCIDNNVNIINMSFGTSTHSNAMKKAIEDAYDAGILMVGASGNSADKVEYPAAFKEVMAVAATNPEAEISSFSNTGEELDIAAPGEKIKTSSFFGGSLVTHGTSIAVPHVVGVASLLWEKDLSKSHEFIRQLIDATSKNISNSDECGLIDADYAMSMYETFAENFKDSGRKNEDFIPVNTDTPVTFEEICDNEAYVEGRWRMDVHSDFIDPGVKGKGLSSKAIAIMKLGVVYPDQKKVSNIYGYGEFPEYHGGYRLKVTGKADVPVNYVACYEFLTRIALKGGDTSKFTDYKLIKGLDKKIFNKMKSKISTTKFGDQPWSKILAQYGNTKTNRKYFLWGSAIHLLTDSFAHVTKYKKSGKPIKHVEGNKTGADAPETCRNRHLVASKAVWWSVKFLTEKHIGDYNDFALGLQGAPFDNTFVKKRLYSYIRDNAGGVGALGGYNVDLIRRASY